MSAKITAPNPSCVRRDGKVFSAVRIFIRKDEAFVSLPTSGATRDKVRLSDKVQSRVAVSPLTKCSFAHAPDLPPAPKSGSLLKNRPPQRRQRPMYEERLANRPPE